MKNRATQEKLLVRHIVRADMAEVCRFATELKAALGTIYHLPEMADMYDPADPEHDYEDGRWMISEGGQLVAVVSPNTAEDVLGITIKKIGESSRLIKFGANVCTFGLPDHRYGKIVAAVGRLYMPGDPWLPLAHECDKNVDPAECFRGASEIAKDIEGNDMAYSGNWFKGMDDRVYACFVSAEGQQANLTKCVDGYLSD
jgi:hypothetical protein